MSPLRWTVKSTRNLARELARAGHEVSADTVADLLREEDCSLQANAKTIEGSEHPDRDAQFRCLNEQARDHRDAGQPVISVDTKKKELVGEFKNSGCQWRPAADPVPVNVHDFADPQPGKAAPAGDLRCRGEHRLGQRGHRSRHRRVRSGIHRRWWCGQGRAAYGSERTGTPRPGPARPWLPEPRRLRGSAGRTRSPRRDAPAPRHRQPCLMWTNDVSNAPRPRRRAGRTSSALRRGRGLRP